MNLKKSINNFILVIFIIGAFTYIYAYYIYIPHQVKILREYYNKIPQKYRLDTEELNRVSKILETIYLNEKKIITTDCFINRILFKKEDFYKLPSSVGSSLSLRFGLLEEKPKKESKLLKVKRFFLRQAIQKLKKDKILSIYFYDNIFIDKEIRFRSIKAASKYKYKKSIDELKNYELFDLILYYSYTPRYELMKKYWKDKNYTLE